MSPTRVPDDQLEAALRRLDAAPAEPLDERAQARGAAALERALAGGSTSAADDGDDRLTPRPHRGRRAALVALAAGVAAIGVLASQTLGGTETAYASSWTPTPTAASAADVAAAEEACDDPSAPTAAEMGADPQTRLAERRGDLVLLGMDDGTQNPALRSCIVGIPHDGDAEVVAVSGGGGMPRPAPSSISDASIYQSSEPGNELSIIDGLAGEQVQAITINTADGLEVEATVTGGHYAAWWPGLAMRADTGPSADGTEGGCAGGCEETYRLVPDYTLDVTLEDGTVTRGLRAQDLGLGGSETDD